jgi:asparagine synthase (glutamine-hydrolysing)
MVFRTGALPGFIALSDPVPSSIDEHLKHAHRIESESIRVAHWGLKIEPDNVLVISRVRMDASGSVSIGEIAKAMRDQPSALTKLLPPFGAAAVDEARVRVVADSMGFQPFFHSLPGDVGNAVISNSALLAGWSRSASLDDAAVGVQSLLGWQLGQATLFAGIRKLAPGAFGTLDGAGVRIDQPGKTDLGSMELGGAVSNAAKNLRAALGRLLDEHPDAVLQLTGGLDSRLLLSAIPPSRRRGLHAMTLEVPGSQDAAIAGTIAQRFGIDHDVQGLTSLDHVSPVEAWELACSEAVRLDAMADPIALAAQRLAERNFTQGVRISGLGGEIARGFYYVGRVRNRPYKRADAEKLASWRMFVNEAVEPGLLTQEFAMWARSTATDRVYEALTAGGDEWYSATDALYVRHRMQRWAGATDVAVSNSRTVINPMLDHSFLDIAGRLAPRDKANSQFLARLQVELDPELGRIPLNGRPAPIKYAHPSPWQPGLTALRTGRRVFDKALQRAKRGNRPPAGGEILAVKIIDHLRANPSLVGRLESLAFVRQDWVADMLSGRIEPRPSSAALMVNLIVATERAE